MAEALHAGRPRRLILLLVEKKETRERLSRGLREHDYGVFAAEDLPAAQAILVTQPIDLIIAEAPAELSTIEPLFLAGPTVILLGRSGGSAAAAAALSAGAYDYLGPEASAADIVLALTKAASREARRGDPTAARFLPAKKTLEAPSATFPPGFIAEAPSMLALMRQIGKLAQHRTPVLLSGESGTGKELLAQALHSMAPSPRREGRFVAVNCGALPEALLESLLFGHRRGAFTDAVRDQRGLFLEADGGTLFLDEIGELSPKLQVKLLRVLQDQKVQPIGADETIAVDVRLVAATLRNLETEVEQGRFRADLYYRLSVVPLHVPPLRERLEDILPLARHFLRQAAARLFRPLAGYTPAAEAALRRYLWPGNVRELQNTIERASVLCEHTVLDAADLPLLKNATAPSAASGEDRGAADERALYEANTDDLSVKRATERLERILIERALLRTRGNRSAAARLLGLSHRALLYKLRDYDLAKDASKRRNKPSD